MPQKPFNPLEEMAKRLFEEVVFPQMQQMFDHMQPGPERDPRLKANGKRRKRMRVNPAFDYFQKARSAPDFSYYINNGAPREPRRDYYVSRQRPETLYDVLEVSPRASQETIHAAFKSLSIKFHPDKNSGDKTCEQKMQKISAAWDILRNVAKRQAYDLTLQAFPY